ncbi:MAG: hypothetical protein NVSMB6_12880 [Burkholderiaceae bacterium]
MIGKLKTKATPGSEIVSSWLGRRSARFLRVPDFRQGIGLLADALANKGKRAYVQGAGAFETS